MKSMKKELKRDLLFGVADLFQSWLQSYNIADVYIKTKDILQCASLALMLKGYDPLIVKKIMDMYMPNLPDSMEESMKEEAERDFQEIVEAVLSFLDRPLYELVMDGSIGE